MRVTAPPHSLQMDVFIALARGHVALMGQAADLLKSYELSPSKYNVLRIIRARGGTLPSGEIAARMVWPSSDLTRLLDGLEQAALIRRERDTKDRRVVHIHLTPAAIKLLKSLDGPIEKLHAQQFRTLTKAELEQCAQLLEKLGGFMGAPVPEPPAMSSRSKARPARRG